MINKLFREHPQEVGETYAEHFAAAGGFGVKMMAGGAACVVHAIVPGLFITTGSGTVKKQARTKMERMEMKSMRLTFDPPLNRVAVCGYSLPRRGPGCRPARPASW